MQILTRLCGAVLALSVAGNAAAGNPPPSFLNGLPGDAPSTVVANTTVTLSWAATASYCTYAGSQFPGGASFSQWPTTSLVCGATPSDGCYLPHNVNLTLFRRGLHTFNVRCGTVGYSQLVDSTIGINVIDPPTGDDVSLAIEADNSASPRLGSVFAYNLVLRNFTTNTVDARNIVLTLPSGVAFVSSACNAQVSAPKVTWSVGGSIAPLANRSCKVSVRVNSIPATELLVAQATADFAIVNQSFTISAREETGTVRLARAAVKTVSGAPTTADSTSPKLSGDGSMLAFTSRQQGLVDNDTNTSGADLFILDRRSGQTRLVVPFSSGGQALQGNAVEPTVSLNGKAVAFVLQSGLAPAVAGANASMVAGTGDGGQVCVASPNGLYRPVCTSTNSSGEPVNGGVTAPSLSADGNLMAFCSTASNWVAGDTNAASDVFVKNQTSGQVTLVSTTADGTQGNGDSCDPAMSGNGNFVVFRTKAPNLGGTAAWQAVRKDLTTGAVVRVSQNGSGGPATSDVGAPSISADGKRIVFASRAGNLVAGFSGGRRNVYIYNSSVEGAAAQQLTGALVSAPNELGNGLFGVRNPSGQAPNGDADDPVVSCNGRNVAFASNASDLVPGDTGAQKDVFVVDADSGDVSRTVTSSGGAGPNGASSDPSLDCEGNNVAFDSNATNVDPFDPNANSDVYVQPDPVRNDSAALTVDASYSGNWYNAGQNGHGLLIEALEGGSFYVTWYLFVSGEPVYLQGLGVPEGNVLNVPVYSTTSTAFPIGTGPVVNTQWGNLRLTFADSNNGRIDWFPTRIGFSAGGMSLRRLTSPAPVQADVTGNNIKACYSGVWFEPARSGYGFDFEVNDFGPTTRALTAYWYTFQPDGKALWLVGAGTANGNVVSMDMYQFGGAGAQYPPAFNAAALAPTKWGKVSILFTSNNRALIDYQPILPGYTAGGVTVQRLTALSGRQCAD